MNLDEFRALKAQQESQTEEAPVEEVIEPKQEEVEVTPEVEKEETKIDEVEIEGVGKVSIDELKNGYLRQSDYTRKTQEISKLRKEHGEAIRLYDEVRSNPQFAQNIGVQQENPYIQKINELEERLFDMQLEKEIEKLSTRYPDFEAREVLEFAHQKGMTNIEDAYKLVKASKPKQEEPINMSSLREEIKAELLKELGIKEEDKTRTVISQSSNTQITNNEPQISSAEERVARGMGMTPQEYIKWRDVGK